ncbi:MAG: histidine kinase [Betaproteobacteria bacterium]|nr:histidine kinase [Betaproteobacteria bacterium]
MPPPHAQTEERCLIFAPRGRDAAVIGDVLGGLRLDASACASGAVLMHELDRGVGFVILSEEALSDLAADELERWISHQAAWSDLPFIVFASKLEGGRAAAVLTALERSANLLLLERPVNVQTLGAAAASALRGRRRQYQARQQLRDIEETERHLRLALRAGRLGSWELDLANNTFSTSELCRINFGHAPDSNLSYQELLQSIHPDDRRAQHDAVEAAIAQESDFDIESRLYWPDGSLHWVQVRGQSVGGGGQRLTGVCADITGRRTAEDALRVSRAQVEQANDSLELRIRERTSELARANDRLMREIGERERAQNALVQAQKMEAVGQLTGGIAHDFNNLLHVVSMNLTLMSKFSEDDRIQKLIAPARRAVDRGAKLTGQLLAFARSQTLNLQPVDVNDLIRNMGELLKVSIGKQIPFKLELGSEQTVAQADPNQLEMAVLNLAINARDAMPEGGLITIASAVSPRRPENEGGGAFAVITVADNGTGIPPEIMAKVFDPFFTTKPSGKGTGLGLSQVYGFAQQCGGTVKIKSEIGSGTAVEIWLPLAVTEVTAEPPHDIDDDAARAPAHVMVIEDNHDVREVIVGGLQALGYTTDEAADGITGLRTLEGRLPDLLIVDYAMPDMNGAEVAAQVQVRWPTLPVIIATGYADMRAVEKLIGNEAILRKPFDLNDLAGAVRATLARSKMATPEHQAPREFNRAG